MYFYYTPVFQKQPRDAYTEHMRRRSKKGSDAKVYRFDATCEGKRFFASEAEALKAADLRMLDNMSASIGVYQCPTCRNWHLTSIKTPES